MSGVFRLRAATAADGAFLGDMMVEAANWSDSGARPRHAVITGADHRRYLAGWMRPGDAGFVGEDVRGEPIGAAWYRLLPRSDPGFGYVGTGVPELIIGVRPLWRAQGVGRALLQQLCDHARGAGFARISLSVERGNFAEALYRSEGFVAAGGADGRVTMVRRLR